MGDDIVIFDKEVATAYLRFMTLELGVDINLSKSLVSDKGSAFEFAKRVVTLKGEVTAIPLKGLLLPSSFQRTSALYSKLSDFGLLTPNRIISITHSRFNKFSLLYKERNKYCRS